MQIHKEYWIPAISTFLSNYFIYAFKHSQHFNMVCFCNVHGGQRAKPQITVVALMDLWLTCVLLLLTSAVGQWGIFTSSLACQDVQHLQPYLKAVNWLLCTGSLNIMFCQKTIIQNFIRLTNTSKVNIVCCSWITCRPHRQQLSFPLYHPLLRLPVSSDSVSRNKETCPFVSPTTYKWQDNRCSREKKSARLWCRIVPRVCLCDTHVCPRTHAN